MTDNTSTHELLYLSHGSYHVTPVMEYGAVGNTRLFCGEYSSAYDRDNVYKVWKYVSGCAYVEYTESDSDSDIIYFLRPLGESAHKKLNLHEGVLETCSKLRESEEWLRGVGMLPEASDVSKVLESMRSMEQSATACRATYLRNCE